jgi:hypothetical protein
VLLDHTEAVRIQLHDLAGPRLAAEAERERLMDQTTPLIRAAHDLGVMPTELERLTGLSRRTIYNLLAKQ